MLPLVTRLRPADNPDLHLPALLLSRYLFFLTRRPISASNQHYLHKRIAGLRSLGVHFEGVEDPAAEEAVQLLRGLNPSNLNQLAERLQLALLRFTSTELPRDYINTSPPVTEFFTGERQRIAVVLGPGIGIGDEAITFPLPSSMVRANPRSEVVVFTGYPGLWDHVDGVEQVVTYTTHDNLVEILRGTGPAGRFDLVVFIDFENPELFQAVAQEPNVRRYAEVSIGAQVVKAVDNENGLVSTVSLPPGCFGNFYQGFDHLMRQSGLPSADRFDSAPTNQRPLDRDTEVRIFVSPFSSKYDPSLRYWSGLLRSLTEAGIPRPVRLVVDPGPNLVTRRFATRLCRNLSSAEVNCGVAQGDQRRNGGAWLSLKGVIDEIRACQVVICADSFAAHLGPAMDRPTLVLPSPRLENWRVPYSGSYYFDVTGPLAEVASGLGFVITHRVIGYGTAPFPDEAAHFVPAMQRLDALTSSIDDSYADLVEAFGEFLDTTKLVVADVDSWARASGATFRDFDYSLLPRRFDDDGEFIGSQREHVRDYMASALAEWRNTNLAKYLEGAAREQV